MTVSKTETMPHGITRILKYEATSATRVRVAAAKGTKQGALVPYGLADNAYFIALADEQNGTVPIQPLNCVVDTRAVPDEDITRAGGYQALQKAWFKFGIAADGVDPRQFEKKLNTEPGIDRAHSGVVENHS